MPGKRLIIRHARQPVDLATSRNQQGGERAKGESPGEATRRYDHPITP